MTTVDDGGMLARDVVAFVWEDWRQRFPIKPVVIRFGPSEKKKKKKKEVIQTREKKKSNLFIRFSNAADPTLSLCAFFKTRLGNMIGGALATRLPNESFYVSPIVLGVAVDTHTHKEESFRGHVLDKGTTELETIFPGETYYL